MLLITNYSLSYFENSFLYFERFVYSFEILLQFQLLLVVVDVVDRSINHVEARLHA